MVVETEILEAWNREELSERLRLSKIACVWLLVLMPAGASLDILVYPDWFGRFLMVRLASDFVVLLILGAHFTVVGRRHIRVLTLSWLTTTQVTICYMIYITGGFSTTYYAGLNLAILAMGIALPVTVAEVAVFSALTFGMYIVAGLARATVDVDYVLIYNNMFFMLTTAIISTIAVYVNRHRRFREFRLNYELNNQNQELAELDRLKSDFFANISHEFRTPLTLILAPLERLLQEHRELPDELRRQLELMRQNSLRLLRLVNDLLDIIRLEEGQAAMERRILRLDTILNGLVESVLPLAEQRHITLENHVSDEPVWVSGDRGALEKIFINLLSNALKFTNEGGRVTARSQVHADTVVVTVQDTGIGVSRENQPYIFDRFRQADSSTTRKYGGTGLGLALVKDLTERHGGTVTLTSEDGNGTVVSVTLPTVDANEITIAADTQSAPEEEARNRLDLEAQAQAVGALPAPGATRAATAAPDERQGTLLIVDDEPDIRRYLVDLLQDEYHVLVARDGQEGLDMTRQFRPDLIILDLMLPEIDGLEACRRIKQDPELRRSRIVLLTARAEEPSKLAALRHGADDFLTKPFSSVEVRTRLRNLLRSSGLERDLSHRNTELEEAVAELRKTQDQLIHSEKLNALGRLAAGLLHEINNPLNYTLTALEFARHDPAVEAEPDLKETLADIDGGMQRIRGIVKELRAFAYPAKSEHNEFQLSDASDAALQMLAHETRGTRIDNRIEPGWTVIGSRNHVTQVIVNLLSNALKALRSTGAEQQGLITLSAEPHGDRLVFCVRDNGPGIPADTIDHIFDPFYTTADVGEGMGMGLSVCHTIIRNHDGELRVESKEGEWAEFSFDLTLKSSAENTEQSPTAVGNTP